MLILLAIAGGLYAAYWLGTQDVAAAPVAAVKVPEPEIYHTLGHGRVTHKK
jgi:hypothetical protein